MKDNCEGDDFTPSLSVGDHKINAKEGDVVNGDKEYFWWDPKEENISDLKPSFELPNEVEDKPPPTGCKLDNMNGCEKENMKEKNMMERDVHSQIFVLSSSMVKLQPH